MAYKSLILHVDQTPQSAERIRLAAAIAQAEATHLIGTAMTGISHVVFKAGAFNQHDPLFEHRLQSLRDYARKSLEGFEKIVADTGLHSVESRLLDDDVADGMILQSRYADLVVLGQFDSVSTIPGVMSDFPVSVLMNCIRPVLIMPIAQKFSGMPKHPLVAWDGSMTAARAIVAALPLLKHTSRTDLIILNPSARPDVHGEEPGADMARYLSQHGVKVNVLIRETRINEGEALLSVCADEGTDLMVMGGYGHTRFREMMMGGATRKVLSSMTVPVLMSH